MKVKERNDGRRCDEPVGRFGFRQPSVAPDSTRRPRSLRADRPVRQPDTLPAAHWAWPTVPAHSLAVGEVLAVTCSARTDSGRSGRLRLRQVVALDRAGRPRPSSSTVRLVVEPLRAAASWS